MSEIAKLGTGERYPIFGAAVLSIFVTSTLATTSPALAAAQAKLGSFAWMSCSEKFSGDAKMAEAAKGHVPSHCAGDPMTRQAVFNICHDQYGAMVLTVARTKSGWQCRYSSPTGKPRKK